MRSETGTTICFPDRLYDKGVELNQGHIMHINKKAVTNQVTAFLKSINIAIYPPVSLYMLK